MTCGVVGVGEVIAGEAEFIHAFTSEIVPPAIETAQTNTSYDEQESRLSRWLLLAGMIAAPLFLLAKWHRLDRTPMRPLVAPPLVALILALMVFVLGQIGLHIAANLAGLASENEFNQAGLRGQAILMIGHYAGAASILAVFFILVHRAASGYARRQMPPIHAALLGVGALLLFWPMVMLVSWIITMIVERITGAPLDAIAHSTLAQLQQADRDVWYTIVIAMVVIAAPVTEEVVYRGLLQDALRRAGVKPWAAIIIVSVIFAIMHLAAAPQPSAIPGLLASLFILSLGFGWAYEKTGRLLTPIVMHMLFNAGNLVAATWIS